MKTASLAFPFAAPRRRNRGLVTRYLPHLVIAALLFSVLLLANHAVPTSHPAGHPAAHMGREQ